MLIRHESISNETRQSLPRRLASFAIDTFLKHEENKERRHLDKELGSSDERIIAYQKLYDAIGKRYAELSRMERNKVEVEVDELSDVHERGIFTEFKFPPPRLRGRRACIYMFDPSEYRTGEFYVIQKHDAGEYGVDYTVTCLGSEADNTGNRTGYSFALNREVMFSDSPQVEINQFVNKNDKLEETILSGEVFDRLGTLKSAESRSTIGYQMMSADYADEFSKKVASFAPIYY